MSVEELQDLAKFNVGFNPQALSGTTDIVGEIIDMQGYRSCTFILQTDDIAVGSLVAQLLIEDGDNSGLSDAAAVADTFLSGTEAGTAITETTDSAALAVTYVGPKRYVRATLTVTTNAGTDVVACAAVQTWKKGIV